jgi:hypothetical protein
LYFLFEDKKGISWFVLGVMKNGRGSKIAKGSLDPGNIPAKNNELLLTEPGS